MGLLSNREPRKTEISESDDSKKSFKTMAFKVEEDLQTALKIYCMLNGKIMADELNAMIRDYLKKHDAFTR